MKKTTMAKKLFFSIIMGCTLVLAACGTGNDANSDNQSGDSNDQAQNNEKKVINVGTEATFAPFEFMDKGELTGFDVDLIHAVAEEAGYEINMENTGWDAMFAGLQQKSIDIGMSGITIDDERKESYDFSVPYFESTSMIAFKDGVEIKNAEDLKGKKIGVQNGTTGQFAAEAVVGKDSPDISKYETAALMFQALQSNNVDAVVTDIAVALEFAKNNPDSNVKTVGDEERFEPEYYGIAFQKDSPIREDFNKALNTLFDNGKYAELYKKWFGEEPDIEALKNAANE